MAPRSAGLFTRAAMESGPYARWSSFNMTVAERHYQAIVDAVGYDTLVIQSFDFEQMASCFLRWALTEKYSRCTANGVGADQVACLRSLDKETILRNYHDSATGLPPGMCAWAPTIDGVELAAPSQLLAQAGQFHRVPVMLGTNENEGRKACHILPLFSLVTSG